MKRLKFVCSTGECKNNCVFYVNLPDDAEPDDVFADFPCMLNQHDPLGFDGVYANWKPAPVDDDTVSSLKDDIIPKTLTKEEFRRGDNLPTTPGEKKMLLFQDAHDPVVIFDDIGKVHTIPTGEYGAGTWKIVHRGGCSVERRSSGYRFIFDDASYNIIPDIPHQISLKNVKLT